MSDSFLKRFSDPSKVRFIESGIRGQESTLSSLYALKDGHKAEYVRTIVLSSKPPENKPKI